MNLQALLGCELPILQAPMAGVQDSALAVAVSNAGGLGALPCAMLTPTTLRSELATIATQTARPFNANFFCHAAPTPDAARESAWRALLAPWYAAYGIDPAAPATAASRTPFDDATADLLETLRPPVVSFHFGLPDAERLARVRRWGSTILASATTVAEARWLASNGADAIIAQGLEAGGHRGHFLSSDLSLQSGLFSLLPQIVRAVDIPVIAAGGIADARGVTAALALGAVAVQIGTAYLLSPEATTSAVHRAALQDESAAHTALTNLFSGRPARGIVNRAMRELGPIQPLAPEFPLAAAAVAPLRAAAERAGRSDFSPLWAGQSAPACRVVGAAALTRELAGV